MIINYDQIDKSENRIQSIWKQSLKEDDERIIK